MAASAQPHVNLVVVVFSGDVGDAVCQVRGFWQVRGGQGEGVLWHLRIHRPLQVLLQDHELGRQPHSIIQGN